MVAFAGLVLTGGASRRMGRDKALLRVRGVALARRVADVLAAAGAEPVVAVGGALDELGALGLLAIPDAEHGAGPLAAVAGAARNLPDASVVVVAACDLPELGPGAVTTLVDALLAAPTALAAVPVSGGVRQVHLLALRRRGVEQLVAAAGTGERSLNRFLTGVEVVEVVGIEPSVRDVDRPEDLVRYAPAVSIPEIDLDSFAQHHANGAHVLDVRNPDEHADAHISGVQLIPLGELVDRVGEVPGEGTVYVVCAMGGRSAKAVEFLTTQGIDAVNVLGGTKGWIASGRDVVAGDA